MNWLEEIPFGLVLCRADGEDVTVTALSEAGLRVRRIGDEPIRRLGLSFLKSDFSGYLLLEPSLWRETATAKGKYGFETEIAIDDTEFAAEVRRVMRFYARYIRLKAEGDDEFVASELTGCPYEDAPNETLDEQKRRWFSALRGFEVPGDWELALALDRPELYEGFVESDFDDFQRDFFKRNHLSGHALFSRRAARIYVGNEFCLKLCPDEETISAIGERARAQGVRITAVLPPLREAHAEKGRALAAAFSPWADEIEVNDVGSLCALGGLGMALLLGVHLNRRRKDPRMPWKAGDKAILAENGVNSAEYMEWMRARGVTRVEYETCGYPIRLGAGAASVHFPFYQTNTSHDCPLAAECLQRDAGRSVGECGKICLRYARVYPEWMKLVGRYNSLFGLDLEALRAPERLMDLLGQGADRLVAGLL